MRKIISLLLAALLLLTPTAVLADSAQVYERTLTLLEVGDTNLGYTGVPVLPTGSDDGTAPEGIVTVDVLADQQSIRMSHGKDYLWWSPVPAEDCMSAFIVMCGLYGELIGGESGLLTLNYTDSQDTIAISTERDAYLFIQTLYNMMQK